jgi:mannose-1-phosphate guanylyltransferase
MLHALLMAGGGGTRFWPRSRQHCPKQFLKLAGGRTLLQQALDRIAGVAPPERTWIITSGGQEQLVAEQLPEIPRDRIIAEPCGRDTAACIGLGAALIAADDPDATLVAMPADHVIEPEQEFRRAVLAGVRLAEEHPRASIIFGIPPSHPATGYGYVHRGKPLVGRQGISVFAVESFKEKPDVETAERYVVSGEYYWNGGIFIWQVETLLAMLRERQPQLHTAIRRIATNWLTSERDEVFQQAYEPLQRLSIDYAVMEDCQEAIVIQAPFRWDDVGSWLAFERMHPQDAERNTIRATHCGLNTQNCLIVGDPGRLIATVNIENLIIVQDGDATLIADKRDEAAIKKLVGHLKQQGWDQYL